jgi:hypothetical protein
MSAIEAGKLSFEKIAFNLKDFLPSLISTFTYQAREKRIALDYHIDDPRKKTTSVHQEAILRIQGRRDEASSRRRRSQKPDCLHTPADVSRQGIGFRRPALPISQCAQMFGTGKTAAA